MNTPLILYTAYTIFAIAIVIVAFVLTKRKPNKDFWVKTVEAEDEYGCLIGQSNGHIAPVVEMERAATVAEIIAALQTMPQDYPCYVRPKYHGTIEYTDDVAINTNGISRMEPDQNVYPGKPCHVTFLL